MPNNKIKLLVCPSYYNGTSIIGYDVEGDAELEIVQIDLELPDLWAITTVEEAETAEAKLVQMLADVTSVQHPYNDIDADRDFIIDDIEYELQEVQYQKAAVMRGVNRWDDEFLAAIGTPDDLMAVAAEHQLELDELPASIRDAADELFDIDDCFD